MLYLQVRKTVLDTGNITELIYTEGSQIVLDVKNDVVLVNRRNFLIPDRLAIGRLPGKGEEHSIIFKEVTTPIEIEGFNKLTYHYLDLTSPDTTESFREYVLLKLVDYTYCDIVVLMQKFKIEVLF